ncbi:hypothetical protein JEG43_03140 [Anoxybacillus sp. LAT_35]|nr:MULTISPECIES: hypothetical protein [unclassified Anoxybacillus]MCG6172170.1 hypothetical protein [Anoxybacillus sp. LAT_11]MCG6174413.1 hypothetical protein [Anoxybacillus sp. LAT_31]MCG6182334.1 hypothetical protein [Anoxybacillus sp. LAT_26]MCG6177052.1 hypothetical protein [Anoxybacillus sp. LAT_35]MCG6179731.1 hypothetical protein [Anoxybacillus sp. LAT_33]
MTKLEEIRQTKCCVYKIRQIDAHVFDMSGQNKRAKGGMAMAKKEKKKKQKPKQEETTGFGDKKLEGPDRPST